MMKKNLHAISLTLLAALSGTAAAQSSVTTYGLIDIYAGRFTGAVTGTNAADKAVKRIDGGGLSTSRLGFRGSEDLGGGLSAGFDLAAFIRNDTGEIGRSGAIGAPVNVAADPFWSNQSWVGVLSKDYGRLRLGSTSTPVFVAAISSNAFGDSTVFSPLNLLLFIGGPLSGGTGWTNQIAYDTPNLGGFTLALAVSASEGQGGRNSGLRAAYANGPVAASLSVQDVKKNPATFADGTSPNNTKAWLLAATYDFGAVKLQGHLARIQNDGTEAAPLDIGYRVVEISATVPLGAGNLLLGYGSRKTSDTVGPVPATAAGGNRERRLFTVGYDHSLSKRTDVYTMVMNDKTVTNTLPAPPRLLSASATQFGVGLRHRF